MHININYNLRFVNPMDWMDHPAGIAEIIECFTTMIDFATYKLFI